MVVFLAIVGVVAAGLSGLLLFFADTILQQIAAILGLSLGVIALGLASIIERLDHIAANTPKRQS